MDSATKETRTRLGTLTLAALGVVYGDLGTSPLYAVRQCFQGSGLLPVPANILGIMSLIFWLIVLVVCVKYLVIILRADNRGEGGILALLALITQKGGLSKRTRRWIIGLGIVGTALIYGDGMITPAISVLSAVEGLEIYTKGAGPYVVPIAIGILVGLFLIQRRGTGSVGAVFGPVLVVWFSVLSLIGIAAIIQEPHVLRAVDPRYAIRFLADQGAKDFVVLGSVFLVLTGAEALYADIGHFGKKPVRLGWFSIVLPGLLLNYFGQGAHLLGHPTEVENLFYRLVPTSLLFPLVILATVATVIASQAIIAGAFSITRQAVQLGFWPRMTVVHTSSHLFGQVYLPMVNGVLFLGTCCLILGFQKSSNLAAAYGMAVSGDMLITAVLTTIVARRIWQVPWGVLIPVATFFLLMDVGFFSANILKLFDGGWVPLLVAGCCFLLMRTWRSGRQCLREEFETNAVDTALFVKSLQGGKTLRVPGTAVFLTSSQAGIPRSLLHNFKHNRVIHEKTVLLCVQNEEIPFVPEPERLRMETLGAGLYRIVVRYGFSESPNIPAVLEKVSSPDLPLEPMRTTFFLGRETLLIKRRQGISGLRKQIFSFMSRNSRDPTNFFNLPPNRVVELGVQIAL